MENTSETDALPDELVNGTYYRDRSTGKMCRATMHLDEDGDPVGWCDICGKNVRRHNGRLVHKLNDEPRCVAW